VVMTGSLAVGFDASIVLENDGCLLRL